jgi:hypothetical protein
VSFGFLDLCGLELALNVVHLGVTLLGVSLLCIVGPVQDMLGSLFNMLGYVCLPFCDGLGGFFFFFHPKQCFL